MSGNIVSKFMIFQLREPYNVKYGKDIVAALDKKFSGDMEKLIFALMDTPLEYDVKQLKGAMKVHFPP